MTDESSRTARVGNGFEVKVGDEVYYYRESSPPYFANQHDAAIICTTIIAISPSSQVATRMKRVGHSPPYREIPDYGSGRGLYLTADEARQAHIDHYSHDIERLAKEIVVLQKLLDECKAASIVKVGGAK